MGASAESIQPKPHRNVFAMSETERLRLLAYIIMETVAKDRA